MIRYPGDWGFDYELIDCGGGERLERWGEYTLIRPDPLAIWGGSGVLRRHDSGRPCRYGTPPDAKYERSEKGGGMWRYNRAVPESWTAAYRDLRFTVKPTGFKHTGVFPEQAINWQYCEKAIRGANREINVLNLFAYTGGATLACAAAGAKVCHLDAVKNMVEWAKENANLSGLSGIRYITDDAGKFLTREIKRGSRYDAVILDPPSYGRGTNGEMWQLKDSLFGMLLQVKDVLSDNPLFVMLNSYTTGVSPCAVEYLCKTVFAGADVSVTEIGLPVTASGLILPCGNTAVITF